MQILKFLLYFFQPVKDLLEGLWELIKPNPLESAGIRYIPVYLIAGTVSGYYFLTPYYPPVPSGFIGFIMNIGATLLILFALYLIMAFVLAAVYLIGLRVWEHIKECWKKAKEHTKEPGIKNGEVKT